MKCINTSHPTFKKLVNETGMNPFELELKIASWQKDNNVDDTFPSAEQLQPIIFD